jgi:hypothetical protein
MRSCSSTKLGEVDIDGADELGMHLMDIAIEAGRFPVKGKHKRTIQRGYTYVS